MEERISTRNPTDLTYAQPHCTINTATNNTVVSQYCIVKVASGVPRYIASVATGNERRAICNLHKGYAHYASTTWHLQTCNI